MSFQGTLLSVEGAAYRLTPQLIFQIQLKNIGNYDVSVLVITGDMSLRKARSIYGFASLKPEITDTPVQAGRSRDFTLKLDLTYRQIEIIEEQRRGGDVHFMLNIEILCVGHKETGEPIQKVMKHYSCRTKMPRWGEALRIAQSEWVKILQETGYERLRILELPIPEPPKGTAIDSSIHHLEEALKSFNEGDYDDVLGNCRKAIEVTEKAKIDFPVLLESESKAEKIDGIKKQLKSFLSLGPHPGVKIDRRDAETALLFTTAMVRYIAKNLLRASIKH